MKKYIFAITGASGSIIGIRVLKELLKHSEIHLLISSQSFSIIKDETGIDFRLNKSSQFTPASLREAGQAVHGSQSWKRSEIQKAETAIERKIRDYFKSRRIHYHSEYDLAAPIASGSFKTDGMLVVPCSMKTLSGIANGYANNLIERAADVTIKEGRLLLLSPREMPFSAIHLENMLKLARIGVKIAPPVLAFYHKPKKIEDIVDFIAGKILDAVGVEHDIYRRWEG